MTTYTLRKGSPAVVRTDVVVVGVARKAGGLVPAPGAEPVASAYGRRFAPMLSSLGFSGKPGEVVRFPTSGTIKAPTIVAVGLGEHDELDIVAVRRGAGVAARNLGNAASVALALPTEDAAHVRAVAEGFWRGGYRVQRLGATSPKKAGKAPAEVVVLSEAARRHDATGALDRARVVETWADSTRDLVNQPPNLLTPVAFAEEVRRMGRGQGRGRAKSKVEVQTFDAAALEKMGCGGILGVGQGSGNPPRLVRLDWSPEDARGHVALVGKGITYDSGGLTIKTGAGMTTMKCDMAGAAAVVAAAYAVAELELPVRVTALAPMAENSISGRSMRPGDVLTTYDGTTIEITNTDAEGRLVLADALGIAAAEQPDAIVEISTLTGPCVTALGPKIAGLFGDEEMVQAVRAAAEANGEPAWPMPIPEHIAQGVRTESPMADVLQHNWVRWGSASWAAAVLTQFTAGIPFAHLDVAGPAYNDHAPWGDVPSGGTGFGVRTLVEYLARVADQP